MPHVNRESQVQRKGQKTRNDIKQVMRQEIARDDLANAFAGKENKGVAGSKKNSLHSSQLKSRKTRESAEKEPKR